MRQARIWTYRVAQAAVLAATTGAGACGLAQQPFVAPYVERSAESAGRALEAAFRRAFTPGWVAAELGRALAADDADRVLWLADLAQAEGVPLEPGQAEAVAAVRAAEAGWGKVASDCAACAWDIRACGSVSEMAACAIPVELSPLGDVNALRRQGMAALAGHEVDRLETGLALLGLGATAAVVFTGGSSVLVKAGASTVRMTRRLGNLTPGMVRALDEVADLPVNWGAAIRGAPIEEITDAARLARAGALAQDVGRIAGNTSVGDTLVLLRHVDGAEDAARMARLSDVAGARTLARVEVLGKPRSFRALVRLSDMALGTLAAIYAAALQVLTMLAGGFGRGVLRLLRP